MFRGRVFVFSSPSSTWWSPASLGLTEHLPIHGKQWIISCLAWLCSWLLLYLLSVFISTQEFPHFNSSVSLLSPTMRWVNEQLIDSSCWLGLNHSPTLRLQVSQEFFQSSKIFCNLDQSEAIQQPSALALWTPHWVTSSLTGLNHAETDVLERCIFWVALGK